MVDGGGGERHPLVAVGCQIWVRDAKEVWVCGEVIDATHYRLRDSVDDSPIEIPAEYLICNTEGDVASVDVDDLTKLTHLHEASLLDSLHRRFDIDTIYTYTGPILIAVNPFKKVPGLYDEVVLKEFIRQAKAQEAVQASKPHVFAVALAAYRGLCSFRKNQTVLISGESGAGKTESTKFVMKLLALAGTMSQSEKASSVPGSHHGKPSIENQVLQSNPLLEAFGNAKTLRNDNSSRFGKFIEMEFEVNSTTNLGRLIGAKIHTYLLETVRVCRQLINERNFHAFYQLAAAVTHDDMIQSGEEDKENSAVAVEPPMKLSHYFEDLLSNRYVSCSGCVALPNVDDYEEFKNTCTAMSTVNISGPEQMEIWKLLGCILLLGSIYFSAERRESENCDIDKSMVAVISLVSDLLGIPAVDMLVKALTTRTIVVQKEKYTKGLTIDQAEDARDALARTLYHSLFRKIVAATNASLLKQADATRSPANNAPNTRVCNTRVSCGVLDIFGFECFEINSFEQLCINYTNERLQLFFNNYIFSCEESLYRSEGIPWDTLDFPQNQDCVDLIGATSTGALSVLTLLDEECVIPKGNDLNLCNKYKSNFKDHKRFSQIKTRQDWFVINHFAGKVNYCIKGFIDKNKDQLGADILDCLKASQNNFVKSLFEESTTPGASASMPSGRKRLVTVSMEFRNQLNSLMDTINSTDPHFIRCVKPNPQNKANEFHRISVSEQLRYAGVLQAVQVSRAGYPVRDSHVQFHQLYKCLLTPSEIKQFSNSTDDHERALKILEILDVRFSIPSSKYSSGKSWAVGKSLVFLKHEAYEVLSTKRAERRTAASKKIQAYWLGKRTRRWYHAARDAIITIQCAVRSAHARSCAKRLRAQKAAARINRCSRGFLVRQMLRRKRAAVVKIQARIRGIKARAYVRDLKLHRAAIKIQTALRRYVKRKWYRKVTGSIIAIQLRWKRHCARARLIKLRTEARSASNLQGKISELQQMIQQLRSENLSLQGESNQYKELADSLKDESVKYKQLVEELQVKIEEEQKASKVSAFELTREITATQTGDDAEGSEKTPVSPMSRPPTPEELTSLVEEEVAAKIAQIEKEHAERVKLLERELENAKSFLADSAASQNPPKVSFSATSPGLARPVDQSPELKSKHADEEGMEATTRSGTPAQPRLEDEEAQEVLNVDVIAWAKEKEQLLLEMSKLRTDAAATRDALDMKAGGSEEYLECVLNVLSSPRANAASPSRTLPEADQPSLSLCCDVLFVTNKPADLATILMDCLRGQLLWDEVNIERLNSIAAGDASCSQKPIEFLFPHISITGLKSLIVSPEEISTLLNTSSHQRMLKSLRAAIFYPVLFTEESAEEAESSMKAAWSALGLSVSRMLLVDEAAMAENKVQSSVNYCYESFGIVVQPPQLSPLLSHLCEVATKSRVSLVKDLQYLKDVLKSKAAQSKPKSAKSSPVTELMSLIPTMFTGGSMRSGGRVAPPPGVGSKAIAGPAPILEPTLPPPVGGKAPLITCWQDLRVPNGAAVTSVCFAPIERTMDFHLLCAATKSGVVYTYKVPLTPLEKEKMAKMSMVVERDTKADPHWLEVPTSITLWKELEGHERAVTSMFFNREGDYLITTSVDCSVRFWDYVQGYPAKIFSDSVPILTARIMPTNPKCFLTSNSKSVVRLVHSEEGQVIQRMKVDSEIRAVCFDLSGLNLLAGTKDGCIATYEVAEDTKLRFIDKVNINGSSGASARSAVTCVQFVPGNPPHLVVNLSDNHIIICAVYYGLTNCCVSQVVLRKRIKNPHSCLPLSTCLVRRDESSVCVSASEDHKLKVISSSVEFDTVEELKGHTCPTLSVGCAPSKSVLASADVAGYIKLWRS